jgi:hypothetical protein
MHRSAHLESGATSSVEPSVEKKRSRAEEYIVDAFIV